MRALVDHKFLKELFRIMLAKSNRRKLRVIMRTYRDLKKQGKLNLLDDLKGILADEQFNQIKQDASSVMFGSSILNSSLIVRQYLYIQLLLTHKFNKAILLSIGSKKSIKYPMPKEWRKILEKEGYTVDHLGCYLRWIITLFIYFSFGIYRSIGILFSTAFIKKTTATELHLPFAYFHNLSANNIPLKSNFKDSKNIITWYKNWTDKDKNIQHFHHNVKEVDGFNTDGFNVNYSSLARINLGSLRAFVLFFSWLMRAMVVSLKDLILFRWWTFILFEQYVQAAALRFADRRMIASDYMLPHTGVFYRPIWAYEAEKRKSRVILYFYSTNNEQFKNKEGYPKVGNGWKLSSWPLILVWDKYQVQFVKNTFNYYRDIKNVGHIWFSSSSSKNFINFNTENKICAGVFDVQPHRSSRHQCSAAPTSYYDSKVAIQFLEDIHNVLSNNSILVLHKRKREIGKMIHPKYRKTLKILSNNNQVQIDSELSAIDLISNVDFIISMPFTSTALLGLYQNKPSIFYDPYGDVQKDDHAAHGIPIIVGIDELKSWVRRTILNHSKLENKDV